MLASIIIYDVGPALFIALAIIGGVVVAFQNRKPKGPPPPSAP